MKKHYFKAPLPLRWQLMEHRVEVEGKASAVHEVA